MTHHKVHRQQSYQALLDAVLELNSTGRTFSDLSLREVTRHAGLSPAAFYRHFDNMQQLGIALVDISTVHIKATFQHIHQLHLPHPEYVIEQRIDHFLQLVSQHAKSWHFFIAERWGGNLYIREAIQREIQFLSEDLIHFLPRLMGLSHFSATTPIQHLSDLFVNNMLSWAMQWLQIYKKSIENNHNLIDEKQIFKQNMLGQIQLLRVGIQPTEKK